MNFFDGPFPGPVTAVIRILFQAVSEIFTMSPTQCVLSFLKVLHLMWRIPITFVCMFVFFLLVFPARLLQFNTEYAEHLIIQVSSWSPFPYIAHAFER